MLIHRPVHTLRAWLSKVRLPSVPGTLFPVRSVSNLKPYKIRLAVLGFLPLPCTVLTSEQLRAHAGTTQVRGVRKGGKRACSYCIADL